MKANKFLALALAALTFIGCNTKKEDDKVTVNSVTLSADVLQLKKGATAELKATVDPAGAVAVKWQSSNTAIATVVDGLVTAVAVGEAYIVATADTKTARCKVTVYEEGQTVVTLDKVTAKIKVGETVTLKASVTPAEKASELVWKSSNEAVATVASGVVTGVAAGEAKITASVGEISAEATITVTGGGGGGEEEINHPSLKGSDYFVFQIGGKAADQIADKIIVDFRESPDQDKHLYVWDQTYIAGETSGQNFYGEAEGWVSFKVSTVGWSGFAYNCGNLEELNKLAVIMEDPEAYTLHLGMKSTDQASHLLFLDGTSGSGKACIGATPIEDKGVIYQPIANFTRDGSWGEIEINMKTLIDQGLVYGSNNAAALNVLGFLSGGISGTILQYDAVFIYKKAAE